MRKLLLILLINCGLISNTMAQGFIQMNLSQPPSLEAFAGKDTTCCKGHPVVLGGIPSATGGNQSYIYVWSPVNGLDNPLSSNPIATPDTTTTYNLTVYDSNGCMATSEITLHIDLCLGIERQSLNEEISIFPNPSNGSFTIQGACLFDGDLKSIEVVNQLGQLLFRMESPLNFTGYSVQLDTEIRAPGVYYLRTTFRNRISSQRLVIR